MIQKLLVTLDGSPLSETVLTEVEEIAAKSDIEVILLRVIPPVAFKEVRNGRALHYVDEMVAMANSEARDYLESVADELRRKGVQVKAVTRYGSVNEQIAEFAKEERVDLIAMSTHARSGLTRLIHGSVAESVMRLVRTPVLVVKPTAIDLARRSPAQRIEVAAN